MKKSLFAVCSLLFALFAGSAAAFQLQSSKELGRDDAKNQNIVVRCTTDTGKVSTQTCQLRRYAKCVKTANGTLNCSGWLPWKDVRNPGKEYTDWRDAADDCCREKGLR